MGTIADKLALLQATKADIRQAIIDKGQAVPGTEPFSGYPDKIRAIQSGADTSDATATASDILSGKTAYAKGAKITGNIASRSASSLTVSGASVTVPAGYYPSQVSKSVATATHPKPTISRSGGVITASHAQSAGYTSGGTTTETLTLPTQAAATITPGTSAKTAVASGVLTTGAVTVAGDAKLIASNIKSGVSIFGVAGTAETAEYVDVVCLDRGFGNLSVYLMDKSPLYGADRVNLTYNVSKTIRVIKNASFFVSGSTDLTTNNFSFGGTLEYVAKWGNMFRIYVGASGGTITIIG